MVLKTLAILFLSASIGLAIPIDIGPPGAYFSRSFDMPEFNGTSLQGQSLTLDFTFNQYINVVHKASAALSVAIGFTTDAAVTNQVIGSSELMLDGQALSLKHESTGTSFGPGGFAYGMIAGPYLGQFFAINGEHFELILPNDPNVSIIGGSLTFSAGDVVDAPAPFTIGERLRPVPDMGSTFPLLLLGLLGVLACRAITIASRIDS